MSESIMSLSDSITQLDNIGVRSNAWDGLTQNAGSTGLIVSQIESFGTSWKDFLVRSNKNYYYNKNHRWAVMNTDPIAIVHAERFPEFLLDKPPKSYDIDEEGHPIEIMTDIWARWDLLNMSEPLKGIWWYMVGDGYCLTQMYITRNNTIGYMNFGYYQSDPAIWDRYNRPWNPDEHNKIYRYLVSYIPSPNSNSYCPNYNMHAVEMYLYPETPGFFHFTRSRYNGGVGKSKILPIWASLTKLRKIAWYDFKAACRFPLLEFPEEWLGQDKDLSGLIDACRRWDETEGLAIPKMTNQKTGEVMDYPRYFHASPDATGAMPKSDATMGGSLLRNAEWTRVLAPDGHTEASYVGSQPGQLESSKISLTLDDRADIKEFNTVVPVIKKLLQWLLMMGGLEGCEEESLQRVMSGEYDIKCHIEWEVLESKMEAMAMAEQEANSQSEGTKDDAERHNTRVESYLLEGLRNNENRPMTPVMSSWVEKVGVYKGHLAVKTKIGPDVAMYPFGDEAMDKYYSMTSSGSKGGWMWDNILKKPSVYGMESGKLFEKGSRIGHFTPPGRPAMGDPGFIDKQIGSIGETHGTIEEMREFKMKGDEEKGILGAGTSRAPLGIDPKGQIGSSGTPTFEPMGGRQIGVGATFGGELPTKFGEKAKTPANPKQAGAKRKRGKSTTRDPVDYGTTVQLSKPIVIGQNSAPMLNDMSFKRFNTLMKEAGIESVGKGTFYKWKETEKYLQDNYNFRFNSLSLGNVMNFDIPLFYNTNNGMSKEFACKRDFKKINSHNGTLWLYENQGHKGPRINVGTYNYYWDKETDMPMAEFDYNDNLILNNVPKESEIAKRIIAGQHPDMSTEYYCGTMKHNDKTYQVNFHNKDGESMFDGIAIVDRGNCASPACNFEVKE